MTDHKDTVTLLTCYGSGLLATKKFRKDENGDIEKISFSAGKNFEHTTISVSNIHELANVIIENTKNPRNFLIRGAAKEGSHELINRRIHGDDACIEPTPRHYIMLDFDKVKCPDHFDVRENPKEVVKWLIRHLPGEFQNVTCFYKFSASQNVAYGSNENNSSVSTHLYFWSATKLSDDECKRYFKNVNAPIDLAMFSAVQPHFIANPTFENMDDPLPNRHGIIMGDKDNVTLNEIPPMPPRPGKARRANIEPVLDEDAVEKALEELSRYYEDGSRNDFCGTLAGVLYRGGWAEQKIEDFILELAIRNNDPEADDRYKNVSRICDAIDDGRPAKGIPTLRDDYKIRDLQEILKLLGIGEVDVENLIVKLSNNSNIDDIKNVMTFFLSRSEAEQEHYLDLIAKRTTFKKGVLKTLLKEVVRENRTFSALDFPDVMMETLLNLEYKQGHHLIYSSDKQYWFYNGSYWQMIPEEHVEKALLPLLRDAIADMGGGSISPNMNAVMNILPGRVYEELDPFRLHDAHSANIINCNNGELVFDENGEVELFPHRPGSYLRHCLEVEYDPHATCPKFKSAVLDIFSKSSDPEDMQRHLMEFMGYLCQTSRDIAVIFLLYGAGSNGKTSMMKVLERMMGQRAIMHQRIGDIKDNPFQIGDLDGRLMLLDDDVDGGTCLPDGLLKKISEEKIMTGQHKFKPPFEFVSRAVPVMLANDYPVTKDLTKGMMRRMHVIPFMRTYEPHEIKHKLFDEIWQEEGPGILNELTAGFQRVHKRGRFHEPEDCLKAKKEWLVRSNILTTFIDEMCEIGEGYRVHLGDFYNAFNDYCRETHVRNMPGRKLIKSRLQDLGHRIGTLDGKDAVWGIRIKIPTAAGRSETVLDL